jgi:tRNA G10  N-methylase Trm11
MKKYLIILGNSPELARAELKSLLRFKELLYQPPVLAVETDEEIPFGRLGGIVKVGEVITEGIVAHLKKVPRADFGVSAYHQRLPDLRLIKQELAESGIKSRFVLPREGTELSSVVVKKQKLTEFLLAGEFMARTIWVQDFEEWNRRDYGRPQVSAHIGMLPLKVARMMINISGGKVILDPFCGVGTIVSEAAVLGLEAIGCDIDGAQVEKTKRNLGWLGKEAKVFLADARKTSEKLLPGSVDAIVTEPYLGPDKGLESLYQACLIDWRKVLRPSGKVVIALPSFGLDQTLVTNTIDKAVAMGYSLDQGPYSYFRPQAKVKRNICVFTHGTY